MVSDLFYWVMKSLKHQGSNLGLGLERSTFESEFGQNKDVIEHYDEHSFAIITKRYYINQTKV